MLKKTLGIPSYLIYHLGIGLWVLFFCLGLPAYLPAQILDDSTKQVYGPKTTEYFTEKDIFENTGRRYTLDTTVFTLHHYTAVQKSENFLQNLGSFGTAVRPVFYQDPEFMGSRSGIDPYRIFAFRPDNVRYYDTKSPFTMTDYSQNSEGDIKIYFQFTQNINPNWNVGFRYNRFNSDKIFDGFAQDELADHISVYLHNYLQSKDEKYQLLYFFAHLNQQVEESGGIQPDSTLPDDGLFPLNEANSFLGSSAQTRHRQNHHHIYHQYKTGEGFSIFHVFDRYTQKDAYQDLELANNLDFYPQISYPEFGITADSLLPAFLLDQTETSDGSIYTLFQNQGGIKGTFANFNYQAYFRNRIITWESSRDNINGDVAFVSNGDSLQLAFKENRIENFVGGKLFYSFNDSSRLEASAEFQLGRAYSIRGDFFNKNMRLGVSSMLYLPSLIQTRLVSNHFFWDQDFQSTLSNRFWGDIQFKFGKLEIIPEGSYTILTNYVYFDQLAQPNQSSQAVQIAQGGLGLNLRWPYFEILSRTLYTTHLGADLVRFPDLFINARVAFKDLFFRRVLQSYFGAELHYKSNYFADAYMPATKQFHLQDEYAIDGALLIDVFTNFRIQNFFIYLKFTYLNQAAGGGYLTSPFYPGMPRNFSLGVKWLFFK